jgi:hypothetical protein
MKGPVEARVTVDPGSRDITIMFRFNDAALMSLHERMKLEKHILFTRDAVDLTPLILAQNVVTAIDKLVNP